MYFVSKEDVQKYPLINFNGCISVVDNKKEVLKCCNIISQSSVVGFDTETKPAFQKGIIHDVSLLQLSVADHVFLDFNGNTLHPAPSPSMVGAHDGQHPAIC